MDTNRKTAVIVGVLFIIATVAFSIGIVLLDQILRGSDYLTGVSINESQVITGALLILVNSVAVAGIGIALYPILKEHNEPFALGYAGARIVESMLFAVNVIAILTLLTLSKEFVEAGGKDLPYYQPLGSLLLAAGDWASVLGLGLAFALSAMILNVLLYQTNIVPHWISIWGLIGAVLVFANFILQTFGNNPVELLYLPIAVQEMVFAVWLIVKGFNPTTIASRPS